MVQKYHFQIIFYLLLAFFMLRAEYVRTVSLITPAVTSYLNHINFSEPCLEPCSCTWAVPRRVRPVQARPRPPRISPRPWPSSVSCSTAPTVSTTLPLESSSRWVEICQEFYSIPSIVVLYCFHYKDLIISPPVP